ncbi:fasciclin domain-containing protein [Leeuwenhoekiella aequorea]|uniref:Putative surface protein with fasciclin (FAS1) repeats n=1 Tax=Leeuwenhoekiella aequorea TaxID=283736 RepID=A0A4Q0PF76_9FLAO|nr:fasciclin domain-containing protein [Leeuwenhoekiella aequorea]RXG24799.1 putative surface protein with fasciclin (FAS1) repeats [Leeuwenhoekiella aequorea]
MKFNKPFVFVLLMGFVVAFSSCEDNKKKEQIQLEEQEATAKAESDAKEAEMKEAQANEEKMKEEARTNSIAGKAMASRDLDTLVIALNAAGLSDMLLAEGDYTVFAPTDHAFSELKKGMLDDLTKPENKEMLVSVLQYHVIAGKMRSEDLGKAIDAGKGKAELTTVKGDKLTIMRDGDQIVIRDGKGKKAQIVLGNIDASNGIIHQVNKVLMSK